LRVKIYTRLAFACQNKHTVSIFPGEYYHTAFFCFFCRVGIGNHVFLVISSIFTCCERDWFTQSPTKKSTADITHPHTTTPPKMSHPAAWQQLGGGRQLGSGRQLGGGGSSAAVQQRGSAEALQRWWQLSGGGQLAA
jgi:hypothetical protein